MSLTIKVIARARRSAYLIIPMVFCVGAYAQVSQIERDGLTALYEATDGENWTNNTGWLGAVGTECSWQGINCNGGLVAEINLTTNQLSGTIPSELGNLSNLIVLDLAFNQLSGTIPPELGNLSNLTVMFLGINQLSGTIPSELGNMSSLTFLHLAGNQLGGTIPSELGNLSNLAFLDLANNQLSGTIPSELGNLSNLTHLSLIFNQLSGVIPQSILNLNSLTYFNYAYNSELILDAVFNGVIPLSSLNLSLNNISVYNPDNELIHSCIGVFTDGLASSIDGEQRFDVDFEIVSAVDGTIRPLSARVFNESNGFTADGERPDCSGQFETTTNLYTDFISLPDSTFSVIFELTDADNSVFTLIEYTELP